MMPSRIRPPLAALPLLAALVVAAAAAPAADPTLWPEEQRSFFQDGPALLLPEDEREALAALDTAERGAAIDAFLAADPIPGTEANELAEGIARRRALVRRELLSPHDVRARLLFLDGAPAERTPVECGVTFHPLEIWTYPGQQLVVYRPGPTLPWRLWVPFDTKRVLYVDEMEYWLEQYEELRGRISGRRFDLQTCPDTGKVDDATGVEGLFGFRDDRPTDSELRAWLEAPEDLAAWARAAAATPLPEGPAELPVDAVRLEFPERRGQRIVTRFLLELPADAGIEVSTEEEEPEIRVAVDGFVEQEGEVFDQFRVLFELEPPAEGQRLALALERALRPDRPFVVRMRVRDDVGGAESYVARGFLVPEEPVPVAEPEVPEEAMVALGRELAASRIAGAESLVLVPPETDIVLGLWRAEALVTGEAITAVTFLVDGEPQLTRRQPPFTVEVRLARYPREQVVRAEGYDDDGELVAADEVVLNQPTGALRVRILEPPRGADPGAEVAARAEVVVPEGRRVETVELLINDRLERTLDSPPWEARVPVPEGGEIAYLTVVATLDDGQRAEDVRFLRAPQYLEEVDVNLVELYTTVTDRSGGLVRGLTADDFTVLDAGRPQEITKFELVEDLPLTLGVTIDTSGSMAASLPEAQKAARQFLEQIITTRDQYFVVSFSDRPVLVMPPTDDPRAIEGRIEDLRSVGWTSLHDAIVTSLYYFRGVRGRRALVLLSDGDDTASSIPYRDALEYARRSGVAIYSVGLQVGRFDLGVRNKITELAQATGGRTFFISDADELSGVYGEIERELRSQYLLAYSPDVPAATEEEFREVEVKVEGRGLEARTIRGYYP